MYRKPGRIRRFVRRWILRQCPYCKTKLETGTIGLMLNGFYGCPRGHYAEEFVMFAGTVVYDRGGESIFPAPDKMEPPPRPPLRMIRGSKR